MSKALPIDVPLWSVAGDEEDEPRERIGRAVVVQTGPEQAHITLYTPSGLMLYHSPLSLLMLQMVQADPDLRSVSCCPNCGEAIGPPGSLEPPVPPLHRPVS